MIPSDLIPREDQIVHSEQLWAIGSLFLADWGENCTLAQSFVNDVIAFRSAGEFRRGQGGKPQRTLSFTVKAFSIDNTRRLIANMSRMAHARFLVPLYCDQTHLKSVAIPTDQTLICDTRHRRFHIGQRICIARSGLDMAHPTFEVHVIDSMTDDSITIEGSLQNSYLLRDHVFPLIEADLLPDADASVVTGRTMVLPLTVRETVGPSQMPAITEPGGSMPTLTVPVSWESLRLGVSRMHKRSVSGLATLTDTFGPRASRKGVFNFLRLSRAEAFDLISLFERCRGRLYPFWIASPADELTVTEIGTGRMWLHVKAVGPNRDWDFFRHIVLETSTHGTLRRTFSSSVTRSGDEDILGLDLALPEGLSVENIIRATTGISVRWDTDELQEQWFTDAHMAATLPWIEAEFDTEATVGVPDPRDDEDRPPRNPNDEGGIDPDPPSVVEFVRLRDHCTQELTNKCVPAGTPGLIYFPGDGKLYEPTTEACGVDGEKLSGWQVVDDPDAPWLPECDEPPTPCDPPEEAGEIEELDFSFIVDWEQHPQVDEEENPLPAGCNGPIIQSGSDTISGRAQLQPPDLRWVDFGTVIDPGDPDAGFGLVEIYHFCGGWTIAARGGGGDFDALTSKSTGLTPVGEYPDNGWHCGEEGSFRWRWRIRDVLVSEVVP